MPAQNGNVSISICKPLIGHIEASDGSQLRLWLVRMSRSSQLVINEPSPQSLLIECISSVGGCQASHWPILSIQWPLIGQYSPQPPALMHRTKSLTYMQQQPPTAELQHLLQPSSQATEPGQTTHIGDRVFKIYIQTFFIETKISHWLEIGKSVEVRDTEIHDSSILVLKTQFCIACYRKDPKTILRECPQILFYCQSCCKHQLLQWNYALVIIDCRIVQS